MDANEILDHIRASCDGVDILSTPGCEFVYYDPAANIPPDRRQPFATIVTNDALHGASDRASQLAARGLFRVNFGVTRETYRKHLGPEPSWGPGGGVVETGDDRELVREGAAPQIGPDFTRIDTLLPHPVYAPMSWVCIVSPSEKSGPLVRALLVEAHQKAKAQHERGAPKP